MGTGSWIQLILHKRLILISYILLVEFPFSSSKNISPAIPYRNCCFQFPLPGGRKVSFQNGLLRIQLDSQANKPKVIPSPGSAATLQTLDKITLKDTGTIKGFGAFATAPLGCHTFLGFYEGETINGRENLERIANDNRRDYILSLDGGVTFIDGYRRAMDRSIFSPCHLNHADKEKGDCNCMRILLDDGSNVAFFTSRNIQANEELCFDYGKNYWEGREQKIL